MIKPPSSQKTFDAFFASDPAIVSLPGEASDEAKKDLEDRIERARETGEWADVTLPGEAPTRFTFRQLSSDVAGDLHSRLKDSRSHQDQFRVYRDAFLLAVVEVKNLPDAGKVDFVQHRDYGRIATPAFLDRAGLTGYAGAAVMIELGSYVLFRASAINPKS